ncbi:MAG: T9SS type A sorting domain-containing protein, partial [Bacteroidota bacterium]
MKTPLLLFLFICLTIGLWAQDNNNQSPLWKYMGDHIYNENLRSNVGIGIILPDERLTVNGNVKATAFKSNGLIFGSRTPEIAYPFDYESIGVAQMGLNLRLQSPNSIFFHTGITGTEDDRATDKIRMSILDNGRVGIGTDNPGSSLDVRGHLTLKDSNNAAVINFFNEGTYPNFYLRSGNDGVIQERLFVSGTTGNVGVGTTDPKEKLEINGNIGFDGSDKYINFYEGDIKKAYLRYSGTHLNMINDEAGGDVYLSANDDVIFRGNDDIDIGATDDIWLRAGGSDRMVISNTGRVGIGTTNPSYRLDVTGDLNLNKGISRGIALRVNGAEALWYDGTYFSWGFGGRRNYFADPVGIGTSTASDRLTVFGNISNIKQNGSRSNLIGYTDADAGFIQSYGANGNANVRISVRSSTGGNHGWVGVANGAGQFKAGVYVQTDGRGIVWGDTKSFRMQHPTKPEKEIWYASLEGPEAAAYERGVGQLKNGEAFIKFSEHFELVVNPSTLTVILTPHSSATFGLAVVEKTEKGVLVRELNGGRKNKKARGNFKFDWEVKGVRKGYEDFRIIRDAKELSEPVLVDEINNTLGDKGNHEVNNEQKTTFPSSSLGQNQPNPFEGTTTIPLNIDTSVEQATLLIYNIQGNLEKEIVIAERGNSTITLDMNSFASGNYFYALIIDGKLIETKQMILT